MSTASATGGELIAGKYRVTRKLDSGGMADVFLARIEGAAGFARTVVIKRLAPALASDPEVVTMFLDEARIAARLHHSNIAQVFDFGSDASGYYLAMEYLAGRDALDLVRAAHPGQLPFPAAVAIALGAAAGLHHAHEQRDDAGRPLGIVHRDVTSSNVFVTVDGAVKVIDFGIARAADRATVTRTGMIKGTTAYMSPEQASGRPLDRRSDLFQLGVVLYELVTGVRPFDRPGEGDLVIANKIAAGTFAPARSVRPECPPDLDALIARLLAVDPALRLPTGEAVIAELDALVRRYGWSTAPHELARVVRELAPVHAGGDALDTVVDHGTVNPSGTTAPVDERAAILAGLAAPARYTAAAPPSDSVETRRGKTPVPPPATTLPGPPGVVPRQGIPTLDVPPPPPPPPPPRRAHQVAVPPATRGRRGRLAIAAVSLLAGGGLLVYGLVVALRKRAPVVVIDARVEPDPPPTPPPSADAATDSVRRCLENARNAIDEARTGLAAKGGIRRIREAWAKGKGYIGDGIGVMADVCLDVPWAASNDAREELVELGRQIAERETELGLEYGYIDDHGMPQYRDTRENPGRWLEPEDVDRR